MKPAMNLWDVCTLEKSIRTQIVHVDPLLAFDVQVAEMKLRLEGRRQELVDLRNGYDSDDETHYVVDSRTGEVVLSVKEVIQ